MTDDVEVHLPSAVGSMRAVLRRAPSARHGVALLDSGVSIASALSGLEGVYDELARYLCTAGLTTAQVSSVDAERLGMSAFDVPAIVGALRAHGVERLALITWAFGGIVAPWLDGDDASLDRTREALADRDPSIAGLATIVGPSFSTLVLDNAARTRPRLVTAHTADASPATRRNLYVRPIAPHDVALYPYDGQHLSYHSTALIQALYTWSIATLSGQRYLPPGSAFANGRRGASIGMRVVSSAPRDLALPAHTTVPGTRSWSRDEAAALAHRWREIIAALRRRAPARAAAIGQMAPRGGTDSPAQIYRAVGRVWLQLDTAARRDWLAATSRIQLATQVAAASRHTYASREREPATAGARRPHRA